MTNNGKLVEDSTEYLEYLERWMAGLPAYTVKGDKISPENIVIMVVDLTNGFCNQGVLSSPRVKRIVEPTVRLLQKAWDAGVREFFLLNDTHEPDAVEFQSFPPHCVKGTEEALTTEEIRNLDFYDQMTLIEKNSLSSSLETALEERLSKLPDLTHFIIVGNCTDLCVYQVAMYLRLDANARQDKKRSVIIPEDCMATYDMSVATAQQIGSIPHPGDMMHAVFLHHMALNGVQVVKQVNF